MMRREGERKGGIFFPNSTPLPSPNLRSRDRGGKGLSLFLLLLPLLLPPIDDEGGGRRFIADSHVPLRPILVWDGLIVDFTDI